MTVAKKSKAERTKEFIVEKAAPIFQNKGYAGTSLNDLLEATQLTKGSLYGNFENKDEIALAAFDYNVGWIKAGLGKAMQTQENHVAKLLAMTNFYREEREQFSRKGGCPLVNTGTEANDNLPFLHNKVQEEIKGWAKAIEKIVEEGKNRREIKEKVVGTEYALLLISTIEGGVTVSNILGNPSALLLALDHADTIIRREIAY